MNGHAAAGGKGTKATTARAHSEEPATTDAVSRNASPPADDFNSAFQLACRKPAPSTARVMPSVSSMGLRGLRLALVPIALVADCGFVARSRARGRFCYRRFPEPCLGKHARLLEDRVGDRADVRIDAPQITDQVEVQRRCLDALHGVAGETLEM